jgi:murein DD-endopeptidase MepM/ murein hydrolase activator NlpD
VSICGSHWRGRLGGLRATSHRPVALPVVALTLVLALALGPGGCASSSDGGVYYRVAKGDNLYRIGQRHGVDAASIARANEVADVTELRVGQLLWIPQSTGRGPRAAARSKSSQTAARKVARSQAKTESKLAFVWPVKDADLTSRFGRRRRGQHEGIDLGASRGTAIRASESGKVIHSGWLGDYGRVVIVKHAGHYRTVYAHANKLYVSEGDFVERGQRIAAVGTSGNATGPHLHFELRQREVPKDPMLYLP